MGTGPNFILDKGLLATGVAAYQFGQPVTFTAAAQSCAPISVANTYVEGVVQENIDATRVATGKAFINVRLQGISRALIGAAVGKGDPLTVDATGRFVTQVTAGGKFFAVAEEAGTAAGQLIEVTLLPGFATI
jgi:hypothetical protein